MNKIDALVEWIKQPATLKGLVIMAGLAGYVIDPLQVQTVILAASGLYSLLALFYDNGTRRPKIPTPDELNKILSSEEIIALINLRKNKIASEKALKAMAETK